MPTKDRWWFEQKVWEFGDMLRRLPRRRRRALITAIETEPMQPLNQTPYPVHSQCLIVASHGPPKPGEGTYTPAPPYGIDGEEPQQVQGTGGQPDKPEGESGSSR